MTSEPKQPDDPQKWVKLEESENLLKKPSQPRPQAPAAPPDPPQEKK